MRGYWKNAGGGSGGVTRNYPVFEVTEENEVKEDYRETVQFFPEGERLVFQLDGKKDYYTGSWKPFSVQWYYCNVRILGHSFKFHFPVSFLDEKWAGLASIIYLRDESGHELNVNESIEIEKQVLRYALSKFTKLKTGSSIMKFVNRYQSGGSASSDVIDSIWGGYGGKSTLRILGVYSLDESSLTLRIYKTSYGIKDCYYLMFGAHDTGVSKQVVGLNLWYSYIYSITNRNYSGADIEFLEFLE